MDLFFFEYLYTSSLGSQEDKGVNHYPEREVYIWIEKQVLKKSRWSEKDNFNLIRKHHLVPFK